MKLSKEALQAFLHVIPKFDPRKVLKGVYCERGKGDEVKLTATDGRMLIQAMMQTEDGLPENSSAIVPACIIEDAVKFAPAEKSTHAKKIRREPAAIKIEDGKATITVESEQSDRISRAETIQGAYPKYESVIPKYEIVQRDKDGRRAMLISVDANNLFKIANALQRAATSLGDSYTANKKYIDMIIPLRGEGPIMFKPHTNYEGKTFLALLMPIRCADQVDENETA